MDNRVEKFKQIRAERKKVKMVVLLFAVLIVTGICISDLSVNSLMNNDNSIKLISFEKDDSSLTINFLNEKLNLNAGEFGKSFKKIQNTAARMFGLD
jgi:hypothetical protein